MSFGKEQYRLFRVVNCDYGLWSYYVMATVISPTRWTCNRLVSHVSTRNSIVECVWRLDGRTVISLMPIPWLHSCSAVKIHVHSSWCFLLPKRGPHHCLFSVVLRRRKKARNSSKRNAVEANGKNSTTGKRVTTKFSETLVHKRLTLRRVFDPPIGCTGATYSVNVLAINAL